MPCCASIDIGTNSVKLTVMERPAAGAWQVRHEAVAIPRLGEGVNRTGRLCPEATFRTFLALENLLAGAAALTPQTVLAVGTAVLRRAADRDQFVQDVRRRFGFPVEILDGQREAALAVLGATRGLGLSPAPRTFIDIGGGSTQVVVQDADGTGRAFSLKFGVLSCTETFFREDPPSDAETQAALAALRQALAIRSWPLAQEAVGIGETMASLAVLEAGRGNPEDLAWHGVRLSREAVDALFLRLRRKTAAELALLPGLHPGRADLILAGALILAEILRQTGGESLCVSQWGLRHGFVLEQDAKGALP